MLTKSDLNNIAEIVDEKINMAIETRVPRIIDEKVPRIIERLVPNIIDERVPKIINQTVPQIIEDKILKALKPIKSDLSKIKRNLDSTIDLFDNDYLEVKKRVKIIEQHLNLPELPQ